MKKKLRFSFDFTIMNARIGEDITIKYPSSIVESTMICKFDYNCNFGKYNNLLKNFIFLIE